MNPQQGKVVFADIPRSKRAADLYKSVTGSTEWPIPVGDAEGVLGYLNDEDTARKLRAALLAPRPAEALAASLPLCSPAELRVRTTCHIGIMHTRRLQNLLMCAVVRWPRCFVQDKV